MACCSADNSTGVDHECLDSLYHNNEKPFHPIIEQYERTISDTDSGYNTHLLVVTQNLSRLPHKSLVFLKRYGVLDEGDIQFLLNDSKHSSTEMKLNELLNILAKKPRHAYWYFAHSMKSEAFPIFKYLHGDLTCCVCKQIQGDIDILARLKDTKSEIMENNTLRGKLINAETAVRELEKYCENLKIELETKTADVNKTNTKLSRYEEYIKMLETENVQLKQQCEQLQTGGQASSQLPLHQASGSSTAELSRTVRITKAPSQEMGLEISGGNMVGIYVTTLVGDSPAELAGIRLGDKIVKINTFDISRATKDGAIAALNHVKGDKTISMEIQYTTGCKEILDQRPHDSLHIRTCRKHITSVPKELSFEAGEELHVTKTFIRYDSKSGHWKWRATRVTAVGKQEEGYIPVQPSLTGLPEELHIMLAKKLGTTDSGQEVIYYERLSRAAEFLSSRA